MHQPGRRNALFDVVHNEWHVGVSCSPQVCLAMQRPRHRVTQARTRVQADGCTAAHQLVHCSLCMLKGMQDRHATVLSVCAWLSMWIEVNLVLQGHLRSGCCGVGMAAAAISSSDIDRVEPLSTCWSARACDARPALASITRTSACQVKHWKHAMADGHASPTIPCTIASCALICSVAASLTVDRRIVGLAVLAC
jgi:hypothetical protein